MDVRPLLDPQLAEVLAAGPILGPLSTATPSEPPGRLERRRQPAVALALTARDRGELVELDEWLATRLA